MNKTDKIVVAGHRGPRFTGVLTRTPRELGDHTAVAELFETEKPDLMVLEHELAPVLTAR